MEQTVKGAKKKLVIRPLKLQPKLPDNFEAEKWTRLQQAIHAIQRAAPVECSLEELYHAVEDLCVHNLGSKLYSQVKEECDQHASRTLDELASWTSLDVLAFLGHVAKTWDSFCGQILLIRQIFLYLDRTYVLSMPSVRSIFDMGLDLFRLHLGRHLGVQEKIVEGLLMLIDSERGGEAVDPALLRPLVRMLSSLGLYAEAFEGAFLERSARFYLAEGERRKAVSKTKKKIHGFILFTRLTVPFMFLVGGAGSRTVLTCTL